MRAHEGAASASVLQLHLATTEVDAGANNTFSRPVVANSTNCNVPLGANSMISGAPGANVTLSGQVGANNSMLSRSLGANALMIGAERPAHEQFDLERL